MWVYHAAVLDFGHNVGVNLRIFMRRSSSKVWSIGISNRMRVLNRYMYVKYMHVKFLNPQRTSADAIPFWT